MNRLKALFPDPRDLVGVIGLGFLAAGFHQIHPPLAFIVSGALLFWLAAR